MNLNLLAETRGKKGFTQNYMAKKLNYKSKASYSLIENGKSRITIDLALKIKDILNLNEGEFRKIFFANEVLETQTNRAL